MLEQTPSFSPKRALAIAGVAFVIVMILWNIPRFDFILYPFRLFVTFVHESGHGLAALLSGGRWEGFIITGDGSGLATTAGGSRWLILPAGYLGAALFGAILFYLTNTSTNSQRISTFLGVGVILISVIYAGFRSIAIVVGVLMGLALIFVGRRANRDTNTLLLNVLAILTGLNSVLDIWFLVGNSDAAMYGTRNDAAAFSRELTPLIPAAVWAILWSLLAALMLGAAVYYGLIRPLRRRGVPGD